MSDSHSTTLEVNGMTCDDCAHHVTAALEGAGAKGVSVVWSDGWARFSWPTEVTEADLRNAVIESGYQPGTLGVTESLGPLPFGGDTDYDLVVIGAGSAAFAAAIKAADAGYRVALVEEGVLGGACVNIGCVPSKALLRAGEMAWAAKHHPFDGLSTNSEPVDLATLVAHKDELVDVMRQTKYADLITDYGFTLLKGHGQFTGPEILDVDGKTVTSATFLVATGASSSAPPISGLAESGYLTSTTALSLTEVPRRLAVIGANAVGLELGQFFLHVGSEVTFIDAAERIGPFEEPEISAALADVLIGQGATIHTSTQIVKVNLEGEHKAIHLNSKGSRYKLIVDQILVATGRRPNTQELGLDAAGVVVDARGAVMVDAQLRTSNPKIFAAGDVTDGPQFVYVSAYEGALMVDNALLGVARAVDFKGLPKVTFTAPQIASAGMTEAEARAAGYDVVTSILPLDAVPRALVNRDTRGLVKLVAEAGTGRLIGASLLAEGAGDVIQAAVLAIRHGLTTAELATTFHPYLTMAESIKLAAQTFTRDVHKLSCCAA
ncbi:MAG: mercury(II) reductase [Ferrimicrobium sp.]